eukprot:4262652-Ditylum_brightwellii.AAC.1
MTKKTVLIQENNSEVALFENVLTPKETTEIFKVLQTSIPWKYETDCFGEQDRKTYYVGDDRAAFAFCGLKLQPNQWPSELLHIRRLVERDLGLRPGILTGCLMNYYGPGKDFIPWHYDEVRAHGADKIVASLSLGIGPPRLFRLRRKRQKSSKDKETESIEGSEKALCAVRLPPGSVLLMMGDAQEYFEHELPVSSGSSDAERISLTFRSIVPGFEDAELEPPIYIP